MKNETIFYGNLLKQRNRYLISGGISTRSLLDIYTIDEWKPGKSINDQGCQRPPVKAHYRRIGRKFENENFWLPTSITMSVIESVSKSDDSRHLIESADGSFIVDYINSENTMPFVKITLKDTHKLRIVDGQHRIKGIEYAIKNKHVNELADFEIPYVLMLSKNRVDEIQSFYEINSTPKKVDTDLALQLLNEMNKSDGSSLSTTNLNKLIALNAAMQLNANPDSVWHNSISVGKKKDNQVMASSISFVGAFKKLISGKDSSRIILKYVTNGEDTVSKSLRSKEDMAASLAKIMDNYWEGLKMVLSDAFPDDIDEKRKWVIQKTPGVYIMDLVAGKLLDLMYYDGGIKDLSPKNIAEFLSKYGETGIKNSSYWKGSDQKHGFSGGEASFATSIKSGNVLANNIFSDIKVNFYEDNGIELDV